MIILLEDIISDLITYRTLNDPILIFNNSYIRKIIYIGLSIACIAYTIFYFLNNTLTLITFMDLIVRTTICFYLLFLSLIENRITKKGISLTIYGIYLWNDIEKIEFFNSYMIVHYKVKIPMIKTVKSFKVKISAEKIDEISKIFESNLSEKVVYTKS